MRPKTLELSSNRKWWPSSSVQSGRPRPVPTPRWLRPYAPFEGLVDRHLVRIFLLHVNETGLSPLNIMRARLKSEGRVFIIAGHSTCIIIPRVISRYH